MYVYKLGEGNRRGREVARRVVRCSSFDSRQVVGWRQKVKSSQDNHGINIIQPRSESTYISVKSIFRVRVKEPVRSDAGVK